MKVGHSILVMGTGRRICKRSNQMTSCSCDFPPKCLKLAGLITVSCWEAQGIGWIHTDIIESSSVLAQNGEALRPLEPAIRRGLYSEDIQWSATLEMCGATYNELPWRPRRKC